MSYWFIPHSHILSPIPHSSIYWHLLFSFVPLSVRWYWRFLLVLMGLSWKTWCNGFVKKYNCLRRGRTTIRNTQPHTHTNHPLWIHCRTIRFTIFVSCLTPPFPLSSSSPLLFFFSQMFLWFSDCYGSCSSRDVLVTDRHPHTWSCRQTHVVSCTYGCTSSKGQGGLGVTVDQWWS